MTKASRLFLAGILGLASVATVLVAGCNRQPRPEPVRVTYYYLPG